MTPLIGKLRGAAALAAFALIIGLLATPQLYLMLAWHRLASVPPVRRRKAVARWQGRWGRRSFAAVRAILGIRTRFTCRGGGPAGIRGPYIVVANHRSTLDILVLMAFLGDMGRDDLRWILKRQLLMAPAVGRSCRETGCGYVTRGGDPGDVERVRRCAATARHDGACVVIFPEGTRFSAPRGGSGFSHVLPPKVGGVLALRRELPDYPVLSVTIRWTGGPEGRTALDGEGFVGKTVVAEAEILTDIDDRAIAAWLDEEWRRKDRLLARAFRA